MWIMDILRLFRRRCYQQCRRMRTQVRVLTRSRNFFLARFVKERFRCTINERVLASSRWRWWRKMLIKLLEGTDDLISIFSNHGGLDRIFQLSFTFAIATTLLNHCSISHPPTRQRNRDFSFLRTLCWDCKKVKNSEIYLTTILSWWDVVEIQLNVEKNIHGMKIERSAFKMKMKNERNGTCVHHTETEKFQFFTP